MNRVKVLAEGQTEVKFVNSILAPFWGSKGIALAPVLLRERGGSFRYSRIQKEITNALKSESRVYVTTFVDYYGMPNDWPGREAANAYQTVQEKAKTIEDALLSDIQKQMGEPFNPARFIPYVQMHEFEALLFSDPIVLANSLGETALSEYFDKIRNSFSSPEAINDNFETCPSRRITNVYPQFKKTINGITAAGHIGLNQMRQACPHFNEWITKLESLAE
ncbi:MAG: DUF4276 family protein [Phycisphaerae bacterium]|nr:DUF4276 family protein [Phycisphaerae bacterium]